MTVALQEFGSTNLWFRVRHLPWQIPLALSLWAGCGAVGAQQPVNYDALKAVPSGAIPRTVPAFPFAAFPLDTRPMFDTFMWQNFVALIWPSRPADRGEPFHPEDPAVLRRGYVDGLQPAFMGWKSANDLYPQDGSAPAAWDAPGTGNPCRGARLNEARPILIKTTKFGIGTVADEVNQAFGGPLIDQTGLLTRYEVLVNRSEYDYVRDNKLYNLANWPKNGLPPIYFPASTPARTGSIEVKAAWRDLTLVPKTQRERFFTVEALAVQTQTCKSTGANGQRRIYDCECKSISAGLVGLHIAHKVDNFPQWVWSTFEQVDNLGEDPTLPAEMRPSYFNGSRGRPNPAEHPGYSHEPKAASAVEGGRLEPVNVVRLSQIPSTPKALPTTKLNERYRQMLAGTPWTNYWLIGTQWSTSPATPPQSPLQPPWASTNQADFGCEDGTPATVGGGAFPACGVANITMETYHQLDSCQNCHQGAQRGGADFSWSLLQRAWSPSPADTPKEALRFLRQ